MSIRISEDFRCPARLTVQVHVPPNYVPATGWYDRLDIRRDSPALANRIQAAVEGACPGATAIGYGARIFLRQSHLDVYDVCLDVHGEYDICL